MLKKICSAPDKEYRTRSMRSLQFVYLAIISLLISSFSYSLEKHTLEVGHSSQLVDVSFSGDGKLMASLGEFSDVCIWDVKTGELLRTFQLGMLSCSDVALSHTGKYMVVKTRGVKSIIFNLEKEEQLLRLPNINYQKQYEFSLDESTILVKSHDRDGWFISLYSLETEQLITTREHEDGSIIDIWVRSSDAFGALDSSGNILTLSCKDLELLGMLEKRVDLSQSKRMMAIPQKGLYLSQSYEQDEMFITNYKKEGSKVTTFPLGIFTSVEISENGNLLALLDQYSLTVYNTATLEEVSKTKFPVSYTAGEWFPSGEKMVLIAKKGEVILRDLPSGKTEWKMPDRFRVTGCLKYGFSPASNDVGALCYDERFMLFQLTPPYNTLTSAPVSNFYGSGFTTALSDELFIAEGSGSGALVLNRAGRVIKEYKVDLLGAWNSQASLRGDVVTRAYDKDGKLNEEKGGPVSAAGAVYFDANHKLTLTPNYLDDTHTLRHYNGETIGVIPPERGLEGLFHFDENQLGVLSRNKLYEVSATDFSLALRHEFKLEGALMRPRQTSRGGKLFLHHNNLCKVFDLKAMKTVVETSLWGTDIPVFQLFQIFTTGEKGVWVCGHDLRPILYDVATGKQVLRLTLWRDGGLILESPEGFVDGNEKGLNRAKANTVNREVIQSILKEYR